MKDYRAQTSRQKYAKKEAYKEYLESIYVCGFPTQLLSSSDNTLQEAQHEGSGAPPITELIPKGKFDDSTRNVRQLEF